MVIIINSLMNLEPKPILGLWPLSYHWMASGHNAYVHNLLNRQMDEQVQIHSPTQILMVGPKIMHKIWKLKGRIMYVL